MSEEQIAPNFMPLMSEKRQNYPYQRGEHIAKGNKFCRLYLGGRGRLRKQKDLPQWQGISSAYLTIRILLIRYLMYLFLIGQI